MPRKAYLEKYYSSLELKKKYLNSKDSVESRRWHLIWKVSQGWTLKNSAIAVGINYNYSKEILKKYNELGEEGVKNRQNKQRKQSGGKKPLLTEKQLQKLSQELDSRPADGGIWTGTLISSLDRERNRSQKSLESKGVGLSKKVRLLMAKSKTDP